MFHILYKHLQKQYTYINIQPSNCEGEIFTWKHLRPRPPARRSASHSQSASSCCCNPSPAARGSEHQTQKHTFTDTVGKQWLSIHMAVLYSGINCFWGASEFQPADVVQYLVNVFLRQWHPSRDLLGKNMVNKAIFQNKNHSSNYVILMALRITHRGASSVHLQRSDCGHQHHHVGSQAWVTALNVEELLHADVSAKASFSHCGCETIKIMTALNDMNKYRNTTSYRPLLTAALWYQLSH